MQTASCDLLVNAAATGSDFQWPGGKGHFAAAGTFNGASVSLQFLGPDATTWITPAGATLTSADVVVFELGPCQIRASVAGGPPSGMYANAVRIPE